MAFPLIAALALGGAALGVGAGVRQYKDARTAKKRREEAEKNLEEAENMQAPRIGIGSQFRVQQNLANDLTQRGQDMLSQGLTGSERAYISNIASTSRPYGTNNRFGYNQLMNRISQNTGLLQAGKVMSDTAMQKKQLGSQMMNQGIGLSTELASRVQDSIDNQFDKDFDQFQQIQKAAGESYAASLENEQKARNAFTETMANQGAYLSDKTGGLKGLAKALGIELG